MSSKLLLIDGDTMSYGACENRYHSKCKFDRGIPIIELDENGQKVPVEFTPEENQAYLEKAWSVLKGNYEALQNKFFTDKFLSAVQGPANFRVELFPGYKAHRRVDPMKQNLFVHDLRDLLVMDDYAIYSDGRETDDFLCIWAAEARLAGDDYIVCEDDKDLWCIPGVHYNLRTKETFTVTPEQAQRHYFEQILKGDPTDSIPGIPGVGPAKAEKKLLSCKTTEEFQEAVVDMYFGYYKDEWYENLLINAKLIHLQKTPTDYFSFKDWPIVKELTLC